jgi:hypothetical protein
MRADHVSSCQRSPAAYKIIHLVRSSATVLISARGVNGEDILLGGLGVLPPVPQAAIAADPEEVKTTG